MKPSSEDKLYKEIRRYIESRGGKVLVIGGIEIQEWPTDSPLSKFTVGIHITGIKPNKVNEERTGQK